jgi:hypothetical protein
MSPLLQSMHQVRKRLLLQQLVRYSVNCLLAAFVACCILLIMTRLFPTLDAGLASYGVIVALSFFASAYLTYRSRPNVIQAALEADRRLGLQERFTSSLELESLQGPMVEALHEDAKRHAEGLNVARAFPLKPPQNLRWLALPLILFGAGYLFLPEFDLFGFKDRQVQAKALEEAKRVQADRIKDAAKPLREESEKVSSADLTALATEIERVSEQLRNGEITQKQMLAKLTNLGENLEQQREKLQSTSSLPQLAKEMANLDSTKEMSKSIMNGELGKAAEKAREMQKKMAEGGMTEKEKEKLADELKKMSEALKNGTTGDNSALSEALAKAAAALSKAPSDSGEQNDGKSGEQAAQLSMEDVASILEQLDKLNTAMKEMSKMQAEQLGKSEFCRSCGTGLKECKTGNKDCKGCGAGYKCSGSCGSCSGNGQGWATGQSPWKPGQSTKFGSGMGGPGRGKGGSTGPLADSNANFVPTVAPGDMTKGKMLADMVQKTAPDGDAESTAQFVSGQIQQQVQEMEQAVTKEEIPLGSRELIRQYFGSIDPNQQDASSEPATSAEPGHDEAGHTHEEDHAAEAVAQP